MQPGTEQRGRRRRRPHTIAVPPPGSLTVSQVIPPPIGEAAAQAHWGADTRDSAGAANGATEAESAPTAAPPRPRRALSPPRLDLVEALHAPPGRLAVVAELGDPTVAAQQDQWDEATLVAIGKSVTAVGAMLGARLVGTAPIDGTPLKAGARSEEAGGHCPSENIKRPISGNIPRIGCVRFVLRIARSSAFGRVFLPLNAGSCSFVRIAVPLVSGSVSR